MPLFRQVLEEALRKVCSASCSLRGPSSAHSSKLLLQFEVKYATTDFVDGGDFDLFGNEVLVKTFWATVLSGNAQAGPVPFRMNFAWCHEVLEASGRLMLRLTRRPHCVTKHDLPFGDKVIVGALAHAGLPDIAAELLRPADVFDNAVAHEVRITKHLVNLVGGDLFEVVGQDLQVESLKIRRPMVEPIPEGPEASPGVCDDVDWGSGIARPKKFLRPNRRVGAPNPEAVVDPIFDATMDAIIGEGTVLVILGPEWQAIADEVENELSDASAASEDLRMAGATSDSGGESPASLPEDSGPVAASSTSSRFTPEIVLDFVSVSDSRAEVFRAFPEFGITTGWMVSQTDCSPPKHLAKIRSIIGRSLKADCKLHPGCKMLLNVAGKFEAAEACIIRWVIAGTTATGQAHAAAAATATARFKESLRVAASNAPGAS